MTAEDAAPVRRQQPAVQTTFQTSREIPSHGMGRVKNARSHFARAATILPANTALAKREEQ